MVLKSLIKVLVNNCVGDSVCRFMQPLEPPIFMNILGLPTSIYSAINVTNTLVDEHLNKKTSHFMGNREIIKVITQIFFRNPIEKSRFYYKRKDESNKERSQQTTGIVEFCI